MSKYSIDSTTITAIANAIRTKDGTSAPILVSDFAPRILAIPTGGGSTLTFPFNNEDNFFETNNSYISSSNPTLRETGLDYIFKNFDIVLDSGNNSITSLKNMLASYPNLTNSYPYIYTPYILNITIPTISACSLYGMFYANKRIKSVNFVNGLNGTFNNIEYMFYNSYFEDASFLGNVNFTPDSNCLVPISLKNFCADARKLKTFPGLTFAQKLQNHHDNLTQAQKDNISYEIYSKCFNGASILHEVYLPVYTSYKAPYNLNSAVNNCNCLSKIVFLTNNGSPYVANWAGATLTIPEGRIQDYNVLNYAIAAYGNKEVTDAASYETYKNDPDYFTRFVVYSRYNHDSAVETINSLPDCSAYITSSGGTNNTIRFYSGQASATDAGSVNDLTPAEIAVATSKGWSVAYYN